MRLGDRHLTYCTNIHPGEQLADVRRVLDEHVCAVKRAVCPDAPFGVGLRLSALAAQQLCEPGALEALRTQLVGHGLYVFTLNGFPYGTFHGRPVKEGVYLPDWLDDSRRAYCDRLAALLCALLPDGCTGSISTVPGAFKTGGALARGRGEEAEMARRMIEHAALLHRLREAHGKSIALALEPEPCCHLETTAETVAFFERWLFSAAAVDKMAQLTGASASVAELALHRHLGVCLDACHLAVEHEDPKEAVERLRRAGVGIAKLQLSTGLEAAFDARELDAVELLREFADHVYLHQVVEAREGRLTRWVDLPDALAQAGGPGERLWRVHFHVPIFTERLGRFRSTQRELVALLGRVRELTTHLEVETYSFGLLPEAHRGEGGVVEAISRELRWAMAEVGP